MLSDTSKFVRIFIIHSDCINNASFCYILVRFLNTYMKYLYIFFIKHFILL